MAVYNKYSEALQTLDNGSGKGSRLRRVFRFRVKWIASKTFTSVDDEYSWIEKWGRGIWSDNYFKAFSKIHYLDGLMVKEIAKAFGAFDF
jgi:hypothetical protein